MNIRKIFSLLLILSLSINLFLPAFAQESDNVVIQWNKVLLQAVRDTKFTPPKVSRTLAIVHTAIFDAWAAYDSKAVATHGGDLRRPEAERTDANKEKAISFAAYTTLIDQFPTQKTKFEDLMKTLGYDPSDVSLDTTTPQGIGNTVAASILEDRHSDGSNQLGDLATGEYADYTGYTPINTADEIKDPNRWQPLKAADGSTQKFLLPQWGMVTPFALESGDEFRPKSPPIYPNPKYKREAQEVIMLSATLNDKTKSIAEYWADGPATETPPGHWNLFAQLVSKRDNHTLDQDVQMFFILGNALLDASIAAWDAKVAYDFIRPISAVHFLFNGKKIKAFAGANQGTQLINGEDWKSYISTPAFAEFVSGHSTFSAASAEVLTLFTGSPLFDESATIAAGSSKVEPGNTPATEVILKWKTFKQAADEAGVSRRFGGIHFISGDFEGRKLGKKIGRKVFNKAQGFIDGTASN